MPAESHFFQDMIIPIRDYARLQDVNAFILLLLLLSSIKGTLHPFALRFPLL